MTNAVTVEGGAELTRTLGRASDQLGEMPGAGDRAATLIANAARTAAPRLTGALAASVTADVDGNTASVMSALAYAGRTNYGWAAVGQRAQPFMTDALEHNTNNVLDIYDAEADRILHTVRGT